MSEKLAAQIRVIHEGLQDIVKHLEAIDRMYTEMPPEAKAELALNLEQIDKLPWRPYREGHRAAWIFADTAGAEKLVELIKESSAGAVPIGEFEYRITQGRDREFLSRNPIK